MISSYSSSSSAAGAEVASSSAPDTPVASPDDGSVSTPKTVFNSQAPRRIARVNAAIIRYILFFVIRPLSFLDNC
jgi:hypothetical protein